MKKAIVLLSGGLDSATLLYYVKSKGYKPYCLIFDYGQKHKKEISQAKKIAEKANSPYTVVKLRFSWKGSSLVDKKKSIPGHSLENIGKGKKLPSTYVPGRNTVFVSFALSYAEVSGAGSIFIGANAIDYSGYPDCRQEYFRSWDKLIKSLGLGRSIRVEAPFVRMTKDRIIRLGAKLKVPYGLTWSCYKGLGKPCGKCDSCKLRKEGFRKAGIQDAGM